MSYNAGAKDRDERLETMSRDKRRLQLHQSGSDSLLADLLSGGGALLDKLEYIFIFIV